MFESLGGIAVLLDICKHHMNNASVMEEACGAIRKACYENGMCDYIGDLVCSQLVEHNLLSS